MTLARKRLGADISLTSGSFTQGGNSVKLRGFRMHASIRNAGGMMFGALDLVVYGLSKSIMNQLSTLGMQINLVPKNPITLFAGEDDDKLTTAFQGYIMSAYADFNSSPEVPFYINAHTFGPYVAAPADPTSFKGSVDVATVMAGFAAKMGMRFENSGVTSRLANPYFDGSLGSQVLACIRAAGINWNGGEGGVLAIWPRKGSRGGQTSLIAPPPNGAMIGYPMYNAYGIMLRNLYGIPPLAFGQKIHVRSSIMTPGDYSIYALSHQLESETPNGKWESEIAAYSPKLPTPLR